ncbi:MAG: CocE/NonD family hydrolase C-terminal non-catalytic domain-containing protein, partial [Kibdelosporangium sp.]
DVHNVRAATLVVHGLNDWNVKGLHAEQWYEAIKKVGVPHKIWLHQSGHADPYSLRRDEWLVTLNRWFTRYLYKQQNGVEREPRATIQREDRTWVDEAEWPAPGTSDSTLHLGPGGTAKGTLTTSSTSKKAVEQLTDDATKLAETLVDAPSSPNRLSYATGVTKAPVRLSGKAKVDLRASFSRPAANVTALLVDRGPDGGSKIVTRGWTDPQNRLSPWLTVPVTPGREYSVAVEFEPKDYIFAAGHTIEFVLISSDFDYTLRPKPGAGIALNVPKTDLRLPVLGGGKALRSAF